MRPAYMATQRTPERLQSDAVKSSGPTFTRMRHKRLIVIASAVTVAAIVAILVGAIVGSRARNADMTETSTSAEALVAQVAQQRANETTLRQFLSQFNLDVFNVKDLSDIEIGACDNFYRFSCRATEQYDEPMERRRTRSHRNPQKYTSENYEKAQKELVAIFKNFYDHAVLNGTGSSQQPDWLRKVVKYTTFCNDFLLLQSHVNQTRIVQSLIAELKQRIANLLDRIDLESVLAVLYEEYNFAFPFKITGIYNQTGTPTFYFGIFEPVMPWRAWESLDLVSTYGQKMLFDLTETTRESLQIEELLIASVNSSYTLGSLETNYSDLVTHWSLPGFWTWSSFLTPIKNLNIVQNASFVFEQNPFPILMTLNELWATLDTKTFADYFSERVAASVFQFYPSYSDNSTADANWCESFVIANFPELANHFSAQLKGVDENARKMRPYFGLLLEELKVLATEIHGYQNSRNLLKYFDKLEIHYGTPREGSEWVNVASSSLLYRSFNLDDAKNYTDAIKAYLQWRSNIAARLDTFETQERSLDYTSSPFFSVNDTDKHPLIAYLGDLYLSDATMNEDLPYAVQFGHWYFLVAHELIHGLETVVADIAEPPPMNSSVLELAKSCHKSYGNSLIIPEEEQVFVDWYHTMEENVADLLGLQLAYRTYKKYFEAKDILPDKLNVTKNQLFFLALATSLVMCQKEEPYETLLQQFSDEHIIGPQRLNLMVENTPQFLEAFHCDNIGLGTTSSCAVEYRVI